MAYCGKNSSGYPALSTGLRPGNGGGERESHLHQQHKMLVPDQQRCFNKNPRSSVQQSALSAAYTTGKNQKVLTWFGGPRAESGPQCPCLCSCLLPSSCRLYRKSSRGVDTRHYLPSLPPGGLGELRGRQLYTVRHTVQYWHQETEAERA